MSERRCDRINQMLLAISLAFGMFGMVGWSLLARQVYLQHQRTAKVKFWAADAYDDGFHDGQRGISNDQKDFTQRIYVDALVDAHNGDAP